MKKNHVLIPVSKAGTFLLIALAFVFSACAPAAVSEIAEEVQEQEVVEIQPETAVAALSFTDAVGREVVIAEIPTSIVSLAPSITESLYAIGAGDLVTGRTEFCNYPEEVVEIPVVGGFSASEISTETIIGIEPDMVIGGSTYQSEVVDVLADTGIITFIQEPGSVNEIIESMQFLGAITGFVDGAEEATEDMQARIDTVVEVVATIPEEERVTVFYEVWHDPYMTTSPKQTSCFIFPTGSLDTQIQIQFNCD